MTRKLSTITIFKLTYLGFGSYSSVFLSLSSRLNTWYKLELIQDVNQALQSNLHNISAIPDLLTTISAKYKKISEEMVKARTSSSLRASSINVRFIDSSAVLSYIKQGKARMNKDYKAALHKASTEKDRIQIVKHCILYELIPLITMSLKAEVDNVDTKGWFSEESDQSPPPEQMVEDAAVIPSDEEDALTENAPIHMEEIQPDTAEPPSLFAKNVMDKLDALLEGQKAILALRGSDISHIEQINKTSRKIEESCDKLIDRVQNLAGISPASHETISRINERIMPKGAPQTFQAPPIATPLPITLPQRQGALTMAEKRAKMLRELEEKKRNKTQQTDSGKEKDIHPGTSGTKREHVKHQGIGKKSAKNSPANVSQPNNPDKPMQQDLPKKDTSFDTFVSGFTITSAQFETINITDEAQSSHAGDKEPEDQAQST
ncbi:MAG: hypothetical protein FCPXV1_gp2 [Hangzhou cletus punctiger xinmovirus 1]|uniref:Uncharacterized protein n=1 Tax=Hangzhou cletus punctiger xinmovirus 1 TaxID=2905556 RepID=A0A8K1XB01_9MONO|nr:MAG: hypothetical protein FCPXV1_gp2 [Hangzhou cletus punctiger xinmovirus 1]